jgi:hypothetical protein
VCGIRAGLSAVRSLSAQAAQAVTEQRASGPYGSFADFRRRVSLTQHDLALLVRSGALDCLGRGRALLLREANLGTHGRLPSSWRGAVEPWPLDLPQGHPLAPAWREQWELLGFLPGPSLMSLARPLLRPGLADSRTLPDQDGEAVRLAGLLCQPLPDDGEPAPEFVTLEDEYGVIDARLAEESREAGAVDLGPLVLVEGKVRLGFGVPCLVAARLERPLPGAATPRPVLPKPERNGTAQPGRAAS